MRVLILRTDGTEETHDVSKRHAVDEINRLIGASVFDAVDLRDGRVMLVDDNGWDCEAIDHGNGHVEFKPLTPRRPINDKATVLYHSVCMPGTTHQIAGDVAIAIDEDFA